MTEKCKGIRKNGKPCGRYPLKGREYCKDHLDQSPSEVFTPIEETESIRPVQRITREELLRKGVAFVLGALAGGFLEQFSADFYVFLKKALGFELLLPPIRDASTSSSAAGIKISTRVDAPVEAQASYVDYRGNPVMSRDFTIPAGVTKFIDAPSLSDNKDVVAVHLGSTEPVYSTYVVDLKLEPAKLDLNLSSDIRYRFEGWKEFPKDYKVKQHFRVSGVSVIALVGETGVDIPFNKGVGVIHLDQSFARSFLGQQDVKEGLVFVLMEGTLRFSGVPRYGDLSFPFETTLASLQAVI